MRLYKTELGKLYLGDSKKILHSKAFEKYYGKVDLIFTSPPFPLVRKKKYGNETGEEYIAWLTGFSDIFKKLLKKNGSIVIEIGNSWVAGKPEMSTLPIKSLLSFLDQGKYHLCQQFIHYNPARLPSPAQWVNIERIRVKDSYTNIWWMSKSVRPKANNRNVLKKYSEAMNQLLKNGKYNSGQRPSEHLIGKTSFLTNNMGAIPSNVIIASNTKSSSRYLTYCKENDLPIHPARMPIEIPDFFIKLLTKKGDLILDPFAGSNTTGFASEQLGRNWLSIEAEKKYADGSRGYFTK